MGIRLKDLSEKVQRQIAVRDGAIRTEVRVPDAKATFDSLMGVFGMKRALPYLFVFSLPPKALHPNARPHYMAKAAATKKYRAKVAALAMEQSGNRRPGLPRATARLFYSFHTAAHRDRDNLLAWFKAGFDGLRDAGILADDEGLTHLPVFVQTGCPKGSERIDLVLTAGGEDDIATDDLERMGFQKVEATRP